MELIATSDQQLRHLGYHDPDLAPYFNGVFPSDRLRARPVEEGPRGYIVNIDTRDQPGSHWVALRTHDGGCTVMDSFAIPLAMYKPHDLLDWLTHHFQGFESNGHAIQAVDSQACSLYAPMFLIHMSVGGTLDTFMNIFSRHDFVKNDRRVAQWFQHLVERDMTWHRFKQFRQANHAPFQIFRHGHVTTKNMLFDLCLCVGSVAQRDKASDYESEEPRFESWQSLFFSAYKKDLHTRVSQSCFAPHPTFWWSVPPGAARPCLCQNC